MEVGNLALDSVLKLTMASLTISGGIPVLSDHTRLLPNRGPLIGPRKMQQVLDELREQYDHVLVDTCPIVPMSDALILATLVDA
jgi:Mrp family chromosome partitioning ATPase